MKIITRHAMTQLLAEKGPECGFFGRFPAKALSAGLSPAAIALLALFLSFCGRNASCRMKRSTIISLMGLSSRRLARSINELTDAGFLSYTTRRSASDLKDLVYTISPALPRQKKFVRVFQSMTCSELTVEEKAVYIVLRHLAQSTPDQTLAQADVCDLLSISRGTAAKYISCIEKRCLIIRQRVFSAAGTFGSSKYAFPGVKNIDAIFSSEINDQDESPCANTENSLYIPIMKNQSEIGLFEERLNQKIGFISVNQTQDDIALDQEIQKEIECAKITQEKYPSMPTPSSSEIEETALQSFYRRRIRSGYNPIPDFGRCDRLRRYLRANGFNDFNEENTSSPLPSAIFSAFITLCTGKSSMILEDGEVMSADNLRELVDRYMSSWPIQKFVQGSFLLLWESLLDKTSARVYGKTIKHLVPYLRKTIVTIMNEELKNGGLLYPLEVS